MRTVKYRRGSEMREIAFDGRTLYSPHGEGSYKFRSTLKGDLMERAAHWEESLRKDGFAAVSHSWESLFDRLPAIGCDLDGTFFLKRDGQDERNWFDWDRVGEDVVNEMVSYVLDVIVADGVYQVVFLSGRPEDKCRAITERALDAAEIEYAALYMRGAEDYRPDDVVKEEIFRTQIEPYWDIRLMLDDRDRVVGMWRDRIRQFPCWQVAPGNF